MHRFGIYLLAATGLASGLYGVFVHPGLLFEFTGAVCLAVTGLCISSLNQRR